MSMDLGRLQEGLERATGSRWFLVAFTLVTLVPPVTEKGYDPSETSTVIYYLLANSLLGLASPPLSDLQDHPRRPDTIPSDARG
ncbi:MAG: hypothetical protein QXU23_04765 [Candidatus Korarchaeum sp.]